MREKQTWRISPWSERLRLSRKEYEAAIRCRPTKHGKCNKVEEHNNLPRLWIECNLMCANKAVKVLLGATVRTEDDWDYSSATYNNRDTNHLENSPMNTNTSTS